MFVSGTYFGGKLARTKQAATLMDMMRGLVGENLKIIPNYLSGLTSDPIVLFIDMKIEGISLIKAERSEIGTLLDQRKGDLDRLIEDLKSLG